MSSPRWQRLERLFGDALARPAHERAAFVAAACPDDAALREEVEALLRAHETGGILDGVPVAQASAPIVPSLAPGTRLGAWIVESLSGRGGMGEVYAARRSGGDFEQRVALKLLRHEAAAHWDRFHAERRILAMLDHPGIARLLDGGIAPDGRPYTVMEFVAGESLVDDCRARSCSLEERLRIVGEVCDAVAYAHRHLVVHRDIKPDNILVDGDGRPKLPGFGIAKQIDASSDGPATHAPMTPDYAAPEQLTGEIATTATDVYALGIVLFELLTGERPRAARGRPSARIADVVLDRAFVAASQAAAAASAPPVPARRLRGDLDAIVAKCLRNVPAHRYASVGELRRDIDAHLAHRPVAARSGARAYLARRFVRRHWLPVASVALLVVALAAAALYANGARVRTEHALARADAVRSFVVDLFRQTDPASGNGRTMSALELIDIGARRATLASGDADTRIDLLGVSGNLYRALGEFERGSALLSQRYEEAKTLYDADDPRRLRAMLDFANSQAGREKFDESRALMDDLLAHASSSREDVAKLRAQAMLDIAMLEAERDNNALAEEWAARSIALYDTLPSATPAERADALAQRGRFMFRTGRIADAEPLLRRALAYLDPDDPSMLRQLLLVRGTLGTVLTSLGRFDEAVPLLEKNTADVRTLYGGDNPDLADALHQLGAVLRQSSRSAEAVPIFREALAIYERKYGAQHSYVATALTSLGQALGAEGNHAEAVDDLRRAHAIDVASLGAEHTHTLIAATALAQEQLAAGDAAAAESSFRAVIASYAHIGDGRHIYAGAARLGLARALLTQARYAEAEDALHQAKARFIAEFGVDDWRAVDATGVEIECLARSGRRDEAKTLLAAENDLLAASKRDTANQRRILAKAGKVLD